MAGSRVVRAEEGESYGTHWSFKEGSLTGGSFDFMVGHIEYLAGPALHVHREQTDSFLVLEGVLTMQVGDDLIDLEPGDFASARPGTPHAFSNIRKDQPPVKVVNQMTPGGLDRHFLGILEAGEGALDPAIRQKLEKDYGLTVVGPTLAEKLGLR